MNPWQVGFSIQFEECHSIEKVFQGFTSRAEIHSSKAIIGEVVRILTTECGLLQAPLML